MNNWILASAIAALGLISPEAIAMENPPLPILAQSREDRTREADRLLAQGIQQFKTRQFHEATRSWENALAIYRAISDRDGEGKILNNLGIIYKVLREYPRAIDAYEQSLAIFLELGDRAGEGRSLGNLGNLYTLTGEYAKAIDFRERSLAIFREIGDRDGEGKTLNNLGNLYRSLGRYSQALEALERSLSIFQAIGDRPGESAARKNSGVVYYLLGEYARAIDDYESALSIAREIGDIAEEGTLLNNLGTVYQDLEKYETALDYYKRALAIARNTNNREGEGKIFNNVGLIYHRLGKTVRAIDSYRQSLDIAREIGNRWGEGSSLGNSGILFDSLGRHDEAIAYYESALAILRESGDRVWEGSIYFNLALAKQKQGQFNEARQDIETAIAIAESIRSDIENPDFRQSFFATISERYRLYIEILMQLHRDNPDRGYDKQAFHASEKNRARILTELLAEAKLDIRQNVDSRLLAEERHLIEAFSAIEQRRLELVRGSYENSVLESLTGERDRLLRSLSDLETRIRRNHPAYADLKYPQPLTLEEIQTRVLDRETLLLEYSLGTERSYLFVVGKNEFATYELPPRQEIETAAAKYAIALQAEDRNPLAEGKELAQMLLSPIADKLKGQRLAIVADGKLHRLPFGVLPWVSGASGEGGADIAPLLARHEIVHLSSASSLAIQRQHMQNRPRAAKKMAVFADPVFSKRDPRLAEDIETTLSNPLLELFRDGCKSFDRLPHTRTEAENILALVPDNQQFLAMGFAADRAAATSEDLAQYQILHLSTHGCIQDNPQLSGLALSLYSENGSQKDGFLRLQDIYNLQLNADLVVLSACQTGIGEEVSGEGVVGLTRGFMYAGARRVTVSLWNVSDRATARLMSDFYQNMISEEMSPPAALREARLQMWKAGEFPYKWAAFTMQGDWR
ncbi:MAG: CHAT domain-containing protein [Cyanobacteria bacterium SBLK]|nr:CHAT domain-containing protein [Cyanobacteria bacterium SBLK]